MSNGSRQARAGTWWTALARRPRWLGAAAICLLTAVPVSATIFGRVKGVVHDPQHRPVPGATVLLNARTSEWSRQAVTDASGTFEFDAVPVGDYDVIVSLEGFETLRQAVTVVSNATPVLHVQLELASLSQTISVTARPQAVRPESSTTTSLVNREDIQTTPGADRTNGVEAITAYVPGAYMTHDQLHVRGGHQVSWLVDGVPVPNTNIASNVGPQFDPKDVDYLEVQRGSYDAEYGDRTYGVFNVVPRTGFERDKEVEIVASAGSFAQTNDDVSVGGHSSRFAYYGSVNGNRSDLGLEPTSPEVLHDRQSGLGGFGTLIFNPDPANQLRLVTSVRRDHYQIPNTRPDQTAGIDDLERESDAFVNLSWVRTFGSDTLLTISPFYHFNAANFEGGPHDPIATLDERGSHFVGAQTTLDLTLGAHSLGVGVYGFHQQDHQLFRVSAGDGGAVLVDTRQQPSGGVVSVFAQDKVTVLPWLTVTAGVRQTHFTGALTENATSPRVGASAKIPRLGWVARAFYGRYYQSPPLLTASGPLVQFATSADLGFIPLHGERDREHQIGLTVPIRGWSIDGDEFRTRATNFFDHNPVGNSNVFFPLTIEGALIRGWEVTVRSPRTWRAGQIHLAYSHQLAQGRGPVSGGLTDFGPSEEQGYFLLDHDQTHTLSVGGSANLPHGVFASGTVFYGSGFPEEDTGTRLPEHTTADVALGKRLSGSLSASLNVLNVGDSRVLIDHSETFGGTHYLSPREIYVEARYRFHY